MYAHHFQAIDFYGMGLKDGARSLLRGSLAQNALYLQGYREGLKSYEYRVPMPSAGMMEQGWGEEILNPTEF